LVDYEPHRDELLYLAESAHPAWALWRFHPPDTLTFQNLVLLESDPNGMNYGFIREFSKATLADNVTNPYAGENGTAIVLLVGASETFKKNFKYKLRADQKKTQGY
jgi:hypothetical protein